MSTKKNKCEPRVKTEAEEIAEVLKTYWIPDDPVRYEIGQRVQHGAIEESIVTGIFEDGKVLKLYENVRENNYGRPYWHARDFYTPWIYVTPYSDGWKDSEILSYPAGRINYSNTDIEGILSHKYHAGLDLNPPYQRDVVWTHDQKVALIDSIFNNVDIGKFVFVRRPYEFDGPLYEILDGKQRIIALSEFYESRWPWRGKRFIDLHPRDRYHFKGYGVSYATMEQPTMCEVLEVFVRLNTTGIPMKQDHLDKVKAMLNDIKRA